MKKFLQTCNLENLNITPLAADASTRQYYRLSGGDKAYLLMEAPPPLDVKPFVVIARHLRKLGLAAPEIYAEDPKNGYLLLQDFGQQSFSQLLKHNAKPQLYYEAAIEILQHLHLHPNNTNIDLPPYSADTLYQEAELFPLWYMKHELSLTVSNSFLDSYRHLIIKAVHELPPLPPCLVLRDYHIDNLMQIDGYIIGDSPHKQCGILDFQDALIGSPAYDVMSILEDARTAVPQNIQDHMIKKYLQKTNLPENVFAHHYSVLATIRHLKVLGIFVRLEIRDNKPHYRQHLPHVKKLLKKHLQKSHLQELNTLLQDSITNF